MIGLALVVVTDSIPDTDQRQNYVQTHLHMCASMKRQADKRTYGQPDSLTEVNTIRQEYTSTVKVTDGWENI